GAYQADADLARALPMLRAAKVEKRMAFLPSPLGQRQRTNNHAERTSRRRRSFEKVRSKWRRRRTVVRFVVLALELWRQRHRRSPGSKPAEQPRPSRRSHAPSESTGGPEAGPLSEEALVLA